MSLIREATLRRIRKRLAPDAKDDVVFLRRVTRVRHGVGHKQQEIFLGPYECRVTFLPYQRNRETQIAGTTGSQHRYVFEFKAFTEVLPTDEPVMSAQFRRPSTTYYPGDKVRFQDPIPGDEASVSSVFSTVDGGTTSSWVMPPFEIPTQKGQTITDGGVVWVHEGKADVFQVIEIAEIDTFEITRDVYCDLRS